MDDTDIDSAAGGRKPGMLAALRVRDFALLWSGQTISGLGDGIFTVALVIETLHVDPHPISLAYVFAARTIPSVAFSLFGGVMADRVPRRLAMLTSDVVRGLAVSVIALLVAHNALTLAELVLLSVVFGTANAFFSPASMAMVPEVLPPDLLVPGNALGSTSNNLASGLLGPATGGAIVGFIGIAGSFTADAISFGVSVLSLALMTPHPGPAPTGKSTIEEAREGIRYVRSQRWLVINLVAASVANFIGLAPLEVLTALLVRHTLHASALALGLVFAAGGAAGVVASLIVGRLGTPKHRVQVMWFAYGIWGVMIAILAAAPNAVVVGIISGVGVGFVVYGDVLYVSMMQEMIPENLRGRVFSAAFLLAFVLTPIGTLMGGLAASAIGVRQALLLSGLLSGICALVVFLPGALPPTTAQSGRPAGDEPEGVATA
ncbi:MAG TPA: MFS transporter [Acidimicrobiales bacterium]|nr:MFS transporter [Acidimicrobiales bacterium]